MAKFQGQFVIDPAGMNALIRGPNGPVMRALLVEAERVRQEARRLCGVHTPDPWGRPLNRKPGQLRDSIVKRVVMTPGSDDPVVQVGSEDPIALWHHEGTQPHDIRARRAPLLVFWVANNTKVIRTKVVHHPGTKPNRFLVNALRVLGGRT